MAHTKVHNETRDRRAGEWQLCFQQCTYYQDDGRIFKGYRFIWRDPEERMKPQRGQARIPNAKILRRLIAKAEDEGWLK
jgi:hypothetical protein